MWYIPRCITHYRRVVHDNVLKLTPLGYFGLVGGTIQLFCHWLEIQRSNCIFKASWMGYGVFGKACFREHQNLVTCVSLSTQTLRPAHQAWRTIRVQTLASRLAQIQTSVQTASRLTAASLTVSAQLASIWRRGSVYTLAQPQPQRVGNCRNYRRKYY